MRHNKGGKKIGRTTSHKRALIRNLLTSLIKYERIATTDVKAKVLKSAVDKMITLGKRGDLHSRRLAASYLFTPDTVKKLFEEIAPKFIDRNGGYSRVVKLDRRAGDSAPMSIIELLSYTPKEKKEAKKK